MDGFQAIILVCLNGTPAEQCTERNAVDVLSTHVANELGCLTGWQDVIARAQQAGEAAQTYVRTICRRSRP
jgi:hypothetical protein